MKKGKEQRRGTIVTEHILKIILLILLFVAISFGIYSLFKLMGIIK